MDWANVVQRRAKQGAAGPGRLEHLLHLVGRIAHGNPILSRHMAATGDKAWFGWPSDDEAGELRNKWVAGRALDQRKQIAAQIQQNAWNIVPQMYYGQWMQPVAIRKNILGCCRCRR